MSEVHSRKRCLQGLRKCSGGIQNLLSVLSAYVDTLPNLKPTSRDLLKIFQINDAVCVSEQVTQCACIEKSCPRLTVEPIKRNMQVIVIECACIIESLEYVSFRLKYLVGMCDPRAELAVQEAFQSAEGIFNCVLMDLIYSPRGLYLSAQLVWEAIDMRQDGPLHLE